MPRNAANNKPIANNLKERRLPYTNSDSIQKSVSDTTTFKNVRKTTSKSKVKIKSKNTKSPATTVRKLTEAEESAAVVSTIKSLKSVSSILTEGVPTTTTIIRAITPVKKTLSKTKSTISTRLNKTTTTQRKATVKGRKTATPTTATSTTKTQTQTPNLSKSKSNLTVGDTPVPRKRIFKPQLRKRQQQDNKKKKLKTTPSREPPLLSTFTKLKNNPSCHLFNSSHLLRLVDKDTCDDDDDDEAYDIDRSTSQDESDRCELDLTKTPKRYLQVRVYKTRKFNTKPASLYPTVIDRLDTSNVLTPLITSISATTRKTLPQTRKAETNNQNNNFKKSNSNIGGGGVTCRSATRSNIQAYKQKVKPISRNTERLSSLRSSKTEAVILPNLKKPTFKAKKSFETVKPSSINLFDDSFLNKIESLNFEEQKRCYKRKRVTSSALNLPRKRATAKKAEANQVETSKSYITPGTGDRVLYPTDNFLIISSDSVQQTKSILKVPSVDFNPKNQLSDCSSSEVIALPIVPESDLQTEETALKRQYAMSLYDRRYQNDDSRNVVTNGYISSTRSSSTSSTAIHSEAEQQDINGSQYFITSPSSTPNLAIGGGGVSVINHAATMATLCNIGNSCYLNSVVYTLRFAPRFLHNLHHLIVDLNTIQQNIARYRAKSSSLGRGITSANMENARSWSSKDLVALDNSSNATNLLQKSSHQLLTEKLHELYQSLHRNEVTESSEPHHADTLLHAIQDVSTIFEGNQQQDAHEFLMCVLNSIRETCQALTKAIIENPDMIANGYIASTDEIDAQNINDADKIQTTGQLQGGNQSGGNIGGSANSVNNTSSPSTTSITKASFFSRKSKRKEEAKNSKNSRLQSPLKDSSISVVPQPTSSSLFYLNTVDLSGAGNSNVTTAPISPSLNPQLNDSGGGGGVSSSSSGNVDVDEQIPVSLLKDKERLIEKIRELGLNYFREDFEGVTVATTKCLSCETITEQKESMIDIAVPVPISGYDSSEYTEKSNTFIQNSCITREYFRAENKYRCEQCTGYTEAIRSVSYEVLPRLLVIQLSRFSGGMEKINSYIPTSFTMQCFCSKCCELSDANKLHIYKLYSVITHVGATMTVGHYIAYTCALEGANEYINCPKDRRAASQQQQLQQQQQQQQQQLNSLHNNSTTATERSGASAAASALASSGTSLMKKMKLVRSKASSSGDMSKQVKNLNGLTTKVTNGINKLTMNTSCHSLTCCATRLCSAQQQQQQQQVQQNQSPASAAAAIQTTQISINSSNIGAGGDMSDDSIQNGTTIIGNTTAGSSSGFNNYPTGYGSTGRNATKTSFSSAGTHGSNTSTNSSGNNSGGGGGGSGSASASASASEPIWYMCDDDKIKALTQREFEEMLSPSRKITITPYLLFYARFDLQPAIQSTPPKQPVPQTSWSNDSIQSGGSHKL